MKGEEAEYVISLVHVIDQNWAKKARRAMNEIRRFVHKHTRKKAENVVITADVNEFVWKDSRNVPRRVPVILKLEGEKVIVYLKGSKQIAEDKKRKEAEKKKPEEKKGEKKVEEKTPMQIEEERLKEEKRELEKAAEKMAIKTGKG